MIFIITKKLKKMIAEIFSGKIDSSIWGCRHKLKGSKYNCYHFIDNESKYVSEKYEPIDEKVNLEAKIFNLI